VSWMGVQAVGNECDNESESEKGEDDNSSNGGGVIVNGHCGDMGNKQFFYTNKNKR
jgi:hypothetical protein